MKFSYLLLLSILLAACGATVKIDYDSQADFSKYRTFDFYPEIESGLNELDDHRIIRITDSLLQLQGWSRSENPQMLINFYANERLMHSGSTIGLGMGSTGGNVGIGVSGGIPIGGYKVNQQLTMDFVDAEKDELVWQAQAVGQMRERISPEGKEAYYLKIIQKILSKYPPKK